MSAMIETMAADHEAGAAAPPLLARYAESILWLARYIERIENMARLLDVTKTFASGAGDEAAWVAILRINGDVEAFYKKHTNPTAESVVHFYLLDRDNPSSVPASLHAARENARTLRALISTEMWQQMNVFYQQVLALSEDDIAPANLSRLCTFLKEACQAHTGITEGTFYRDQSWCFYSIGRYLERADQTTRLLDIKFGRVIDHHQAADQSVDDGEWNTLLRAVGGYHAFRRTHPFGFRPRDIAHFLLIDGAFPRSVGLNLAQLDWVLGQLRARYGLRAIMPALERVDTLRGRLTSQNMVDLLRRGISPYLDWMQKELGLLHGDLVAHIFAAEHAPATGQSQSQSSE
jgi:uncharacterized alpha-E superfamily protein